MKNRKFQKSAARAIKSSMARYVSIILIAFLGAGAFGGIAAISPNMKRVGNEYYDEQNVMDIRMLSTYGFTEEDVDAIRNTQGVKGVMPSYTVDAAGEVGGNDYTFRMNGYDIHNNQEDDYINQLQMLEGRLPKSENEAVIIQSSLGLKGIALGDTVELNPSSNDKLEDNLNSFEYTIVGIAKSPYYLSFMQGNTSVGNGMIDLVLYIPTDNFIIDGYTDLYVTVEGAKELNTFKEAYFDQVGIVVEKLESLANQRQDLRYLEFQEDLATAEQEFLDGKEEVIEKLAEAKDKLLNGEKELEEAKERYADGLSEYDSKKEDVSIQLADAKSKLTDGEKELAEAKEKYADGLTSYEKQKKEAEQQLLEAKNKLIQGEKELETAKQQYENGLAEYEEQLAQANSQFTEAKTKLEESATQITQGENTIQTGWTEYNKKEAEVQSRFSNAQKELSSAATQISKAESELKTGWQEYNKKKLEADEKLSDAELELAEGSTDISNAEAEISEGWDEYYSKEEEANRELADAAQKIEDAKADLKELGEPKWYVLDRHMNEAFLTYEADTVRMKDLATVFPVVFFLVAALVCLTTMTRMVDEDRTLIGTFKALGYSNGRIANRYLTYATYASLIGSSIGVVVGFWLIPTVVWGAYNIVFALPSMKPAFYLSIGILAVFAVTFIVALSTGMAVKASLKETPSNLMRPKAPKAGKRIFLENIKPIWNRLSFTKKVTVRNIGLNKKRLIMSLAGVLGCTALVVTAFGANDAVNAIMDEQFGKIFHYDVRVNFNEDEPSEDLVSRVSNEDYFKHAALLGSYSAQASLSEEDDDEYYHIYVISPQDGQELSNIITLMDIDNKDEFMLADDSVVITEKLSQNLNIGVGDTMMVKYLDQETYHPVTITGITTNYTFNYLYIGKEAYLKSFEEEAEYNEFYATIAEGKTSDEVKDYLSQASGVGSISFTEEQMGNIRTSIQSVNNIIWVLIIAAGLLAFVVIYNLTNINVGERQRELATLKVLGFYDKETYNYIFREINIISIIGAALGLFVGRFLYIAVVSTVEPDMILLTRNVTAGSFIGAFILTMVFTYIVNICMKPRIRNIDMLEAMKSVD